jgi:hypothetical protein
MWIWLVFVFLVIFWKLARIEAIVGEIIDGTKRGKPPGAKAA